MFFAQYKGEKGRALQPDYTSMNILILFNLPDLHGSKVKVAVTTSHVEGVKDVHYSLSFHTLYTTWELYTMFKALSCLNAQCVLYDYTIK